MVRHRCPKSGVTVVIDMEDRASYDNAIRKIGTVKIMLLDVYNLTNGNIKYLDAISSSKGLKYVSLGLHGTVTNSNIVKSIIMSIEPMALRIDIPLESMLFVFDTPHLIIPFLSLKFKCLHLTAGTKIHKKEINTVDILHNMNIHTLILEPGSDVHELLTFGMINKTGFLKLRSEVNTLAHTDLDKVLIIDDKFVKHIENNIENTDERVFSGNNVVNHNFCNNYIIDHGLMNNMENNIREEIELGNNFRFGNYPGNYYNNLSILNHETLSKHSSNNTNNINDISHNYNKFSDIIGSSEKMLFPRQNNSNLSGGNTFDTKTSITPKKIAKNRYLRAVLSGGEQMQTSIVNSNEGQRGSSSPDMKDVDKQYFQNQNQNQNRNRTIFKFRRTERVNGLCNIKLGDIIQVVYLNNFVGSGMGLRFSSLFDSLKYIEVSIEDLFSDNEKDPWEYPKESLDESSMKIHQHISFNPCDSLYNSNYITPESPGLFMGTGLESTSFQMLTETENMNVNMNMSASSNQEDDSKSLSFKNMSSESRKAIEQEQELKKLYYRFPLIFGLATLTYLFRSSKLQGISVYQSFGYSPETHFNPFNMNESCLTNNSKALHNNVIIGHSVEEKHPSDIYNNSNKTKQSSQRKKVDSKNDSNNSSSSSSSSSEQLIDISECCTKLGPMLLQKEKKIERKKKSNKNITKETKITEEMRSSSQSQRLPSLSSLPSTIFTSSTSSTTSSIRPIAQSSLANSDEINRKEKSTMSSSGTTISATSAILSLGPPEISEKEKGNTKHVEEKRNQNEKKQDKEYEEKSVQHFDDGISVENTNFDDDKDSGLEIYHKEAVGLHQNRTLLVDNTIYTTRRYVRFLTILRLMLKLYHLTPDSLRARCKRTRIKLFGENEESEEFNNRTRVVNQKLGRVLGINNSEDNSGNENSNSEYKRNGRKGNSPKLNNALRSRRLILDPVNSKVAPLDAIAIPFPFHKLIKSEVNHKTKDKKKISKIVTGTLPSKEYLEKLKQNCTNTVGDSTNDNINDYLDILGQSDSGNMWSLNTNTLSTSSTSFMQQCEMFHEGNLYLASNEKPKKQEENMTEGDNNSLYGIDIRPILRSDISHSDVSPQQGYTNPPFEEVEDHISLINYVRGEKNDSDAEKKDVPLTNITSSSKSKSFEGSTNVSHKEKNKPNITPTKVLEGYKTRMDRHMKSSLRRKSESYTSGNLQITKPSINNNDNANNDSLSECENFDPFELTREIYSIKNGDEDSILINSRRTKTTDPLNNSEEKDLARHSLLDVCRELEPSIYLKNLGAITDFYNVLYDRRYAMFLRFCSLIAKLRPKFIDASFPVPPLCLSYFVNLAAKSRRTRTLKLTISGEAWEDGGSTNEDDRERALISLGEALGNTNVERLHLSLYNMGFRDALPLVKQLLDDEETSSICDVYFGWCSVDGQCGYKCDDLLELMSYIQNRKSGRRCIHFHFCDKLGFNEFETRFSRELGYVLDSDFDVFAEARELLRDEKDFNEDNSELSLEETSEGKNNSQEG